MGKTQKYEQLAYLYIKDQILQQSLSASDHIIEASISDKLEMSRSPIRAALSVLKEEGLVEMKPYRGFFVADQPISSDIVAHRLRYMLILWYRLLDRMIKLEADGNKTAKQLDYHLAQITTADFEHFDPQKCFDDLAHLFIDIMQLADHPFLTDEYLRCLETIFTAIQTTKNDKAETFHDCHSQILFYINDIVRLVKLSRFDDLRVVGELFTHYLHNLLPEETQKATQAGPKYDVR